MSRDIVKINRFMMSVDYSNFQTIIAFALGFFSQAEVRHFIMGGFSLKT